MFESVEIAALAGVTSALVALVQPLQESTEVESDLALGVRCACADHLLSHAVVRSRDTGPNQSVPCATSSALHASVIGHTLHY